MACRGVHFAITEPYAVRLLGAPDDAQVLEIIQDEIEEQWDEAWLYQTDKAWDAIHRCLTNGTVDPDAGSYPLKLAVLYGRQLHKGDEFIVSFTTPEQVRDVASALESIDATWLKNQYDAIDANDYGVSKSDEDWAYTLDYFTGLGPFFRKASDAGRYVVFTVDQ